MTRLFILNRYFAPDESATSRMASSLAFALAERGWDVHAVACRQLYESPQSKLKCRETVGGVTIRRIWTSAFGRRHLIGRATDYISYYVSIFLWLLRHTHQGDLLLVATDPPLLSILASLAARITGVGHVNWLHDLYPEVAAALGITRRGPGFRLLQRLRDRSLTVARMNVAIGSRMADYLRARGVASNRIAIIHNWSDGSAIMPVPAQLNPLRERWALVGKFVVAYSGNLGRGHDFQTIVEAARALRNRPEIVFLFIGGGHHLQWIQEQVAADRLRNVIFKPHQANADLSHSLSVADLHLVTLQPALEGLMVPCKFYGVAAAGRPTLYIGDVTGEIPAILRDADCGKAVPIGDVDGLVECIQRLCDFPEQAARWRDNARAVFARRFDRHHAIDRWCAVLQSVVTGSDAPLGQMAGVSD
jgi:colanic acid biosynthesis glycosyl transferase WcaI